MNQRIKAKAAQLLLPGQLGDLKVMEVSVKYCIPMDMVNEEDQEDQEESQEESQDSMDNESDTQESDTQEENPSKMMRNKMANLKKGMK